MTILKINRLKRCLGLVTGNSEFFNFLRLSKSLTANLQLLELNKASQQDAAKLRLCWRRYAPIQIINIINEICRFDKIRQCRIFLIYDFH